MNKSILLLLLSPIAIVEAISVRNYYVGIDLQQRGIAFAKSYGKEAFPNRALQNNFYTGFKLNKYFGFELGYQSSQNESKTTHFEPDQFILGQWFAADPLGLTNNFIVSETKVKMRGPHLNFIGFLTIYKNKTELIASLGITSLTVKLQYKQLNGLIDGIPLGCYNAADVDETTNVFSSKRVIPRFSTGIQHRFNESIGVRATLVYELTGRFKKMGSKNPRDPASDLLPGNRDLRASLKNTMTYGLGLFATF